MTVGWKGKMSVRAQVPRSDRLLLESDGERRKKFKQRKEMKREKEAAKVAEVNKLEDKEDIQHDE